MGEGQGQSGLSPKWTKWTLEEEALYSECTEGCLCFPDTLEDSGHGCQIILQKFLNFK